MEQEGTEETENETFFSVFSVSSCSSPGLMLLKDVKSGTFGTIGLDLLRHRLATHCDESLPFFNNALPARVEAPMSEGPTPPLT